MREAGLEIPVSIDSRVLDEQLRALRLLVSQIGFALDNYLITRPSPSEAATSQARPKP